MKKSNVENDGIFQLMLRKAKEENDSPLNPSLLEAVVIEATDVFADLLNRTCINFPDYTLHDEEHALSVLRIIRRLLSPKEVERLTSIDCALLVLSSYGHDIGMAAGRERRAEIQASTQYKDFLLKHESAWQEAEIVKEGKNVLQYEHLTSQLFQNFLRSVHHIESARIIREDFSDTLKIKGQSLAEPLALLSQSHGEPLSWIEKNMNEFLCLGHYRSDLPFLACLLRLADYLDLDAARSPDSLLRLIKPETEESMREWRKNQAACIVVDNGQILCQAEFNDFFEEKALRDTLRGIEEERRACMEFLNARQRGESEAMMLNLTTPVRTDHIKSRGYIFEEFQFSLEYKEILTLLMGTKLYRDERVFLRELIQNSLDACRSAKAAVEKIDGHKFHGEISIRRKVEPDGNEIIEVSDNGAGMTREIIRQYFMRVGRSYYQSYGFKRKNLGIHPVSQFGIGILSCFMVADKIEVETAPHSAVHPRDECGEHEGLLLEIRGPSEFFVVKKFSRSAPGTTVRMFLRQPLQGSLGDLIKRFLARVPLTVTIIDGDLSPKEFKAIGFDFDPEDLQLAFATAPGVFGYSSRDIEFDGPLGFGVYGKVRLYILNRENQSHLQLTDLDRYSFVGFSPTGDTLLNPKRLTPEIRDRLNHLVERISRTKTAFPEDAQCELDSILHRFSRIADELVEFERKTQIDRQWHAFQAQTDALKSMPSFAGCAASVAVLSELNTATDQIRAFVSGRVEFPLPQSLLTQDGILLSEFFDLTSHLRLGIGYVFNLDLCGPHRLTLNAARDAVVNDERREQLVYFLHERIGKEIGIWFREENIPLTHIEQYLEGVPRSLGEFVRRYYEHTDG